MYYLLAYRDKYLEIYYIIIRWLDYTLQGFNPTLVLSSYINRENLSVFNDMNIYLQKNKNNIRVQESFKNSNTLLNLKYLVKYEVGFFFIFNLNLIFIS